LIGGILYKTLAICVGIYPYLKYLAYALISEVETLLLAFKEEFSK
jgi:hypothetical protein